jgi:hypothetical protein
LKTILGTVLLLGLLSAPLAQGASEGVPPGGEAPLERVVVKATRENLAKLGKEIAQAEAAFYGRYNELNKKREYAVPCFNEARTGTRFKRNYCQPVFESEAHQVEARNFVMTLQVQFAGSGNPGIMAAQTRGAPPLAIAGGMPTAPANAVIESRRPGFKKNMIEVTRNSPELIRMVGEYAALVTRWVDMNRGLKAAHSPPEEKGAAPNSNVADH